MIEQRNAVKAERGGAGSAGGDPRPSRFSRSLPGDQAEPRSQQALRGRLINVVDAERCFNAAPYLFVRSAGRKRGDPPRRVLDAKRSRLLGGVARQRDAFHRHDCKPETRRCAASVRQDRALVAQPKKTCWVHDLDSARRAPPHMTIVKAGPFSPNDSSTAPRRHVHVGSITVSGARTT